MSATCPHPEVEPIETVPWLGEPVTHGAMCVTCLARVPGNWKCEACQWEACELRTFSGALVTPPRYCVKTCDDHWESR